MFTHAVVIYHSQYILDNHSKMPVTTRAAALKPQNKEDENVSIEVSSKNKKKSRSKQPPKQQKEQLPKNCVQSKLHRSLGQQSSNLQSESIVHVGSQHQNEAKNQDDDLDISSESLFGEDVMLSTTNGNKVTGGSKVLGQNVCSFLTHVKIFQTRRNLWIRTRILCSF